MIEKTVQVPVLDTPATETVTVGDGGLTQGLALVLPVTDALIRQVITAARSDGCLMMAEALLLAPEIRTIVSDVVARVLPQIKGTSARELVTLVLAQLLQQYLAPSLPAPLRGWLTTQTLHPDHRIAERLRHLGQAQAASATCQAHPCLASSKTSADSSDANAAARGGPA